MNSGYFTNYFTNYFNIGVVIGGGAPEHRRPALHQDVRLARAMAAALWADGHISDAKLAKIMSKIRVKEKWSR